MHKLGKIVATMGMLSLLSVMPLAAQVDYNVVFKAPFPFYAGNVKGPAGSLHSYRTERKCPVSGNPEYCRYEGRVH